jgi:hypothetical protein
MTKEAIGGRQHYAKAGLVDHEHRIVIRRKAPPMRMSPAVKVSDPAQYPTLVRNTRRPWAYSRAPDQIPIAGLR